MFSIYYNPFPGRIYHDVREKYNCSQTEKTEEKKPLYEDKSDSKRNVVLVRGTLIRNFIIRTIFGKCWYILYYCGPNMDLYKKTLLKYWEETVKNRPIIVIICITSGHFNFRI